MPIYFGNTLISLDGVSKAYWGTTEVYSSAPPAPISYLTSGNYNLDAFDKVQVVNMYGNNNTSFQFVSSYVGVNYKTEFCNTYEEATSGKYLGQFLKLGTIESGNPEGISDITINNGLSGYASTSKTVAGVFFVNHTTNNIISAYVMQSSSSFSVPQSYKVTLPEDISTAGADVDVYVGLAKNVTETGGFSISQGQLSATITDNKCTIHLENNTSTDVTILLNYANKTIYAGETETIVVNSLSIGASLNTTPTITGFIKNDGTYQVAESGRTYTLTSAPEYYLQVFDYDGNSYLSVSTTQLADSISVSKPSTMKTTFTDSNYRNASYGVVTQNLITGTKSLISGDTYYPLYEKLLITSYKLNNAGTTARYVRRSVYLNNSSVFSDSTGRSTTGTGYFPDSPGGTSTNNLLYTFDRTSHDNIKINYKEGTQAGATSTPRYMYMYITQSSVTFDVYISFSKSFSYQTTTITASAVNSNYDTDYTYTGDFTPVYPNENHFTARLLPTATSVTIKWDSGSSASGTQTYNLSEYSGVHWKGTVGSTYTTSATYTPIPKETT